MQPTLMTFACRAIGGAAALAAALTIHSPTVPTVFASEAMPVAQQNALVQKYCAVCHTDAARNGGLSLQHFDAAKAAPSLAAMMVSKLTSGAPLETVKAAPWDPAAAALMAKKMKGGAMGAAGIPIPDKATIDALINALASKAAGANEWDAGSTQDPVTKAPMVTVSVLRELPAVRNTGEAAMYRLALACNLATHEGEMQLAWAPVPKAGTLSAAVDGETARTYMVEGTEKMGNGSPVTAGPAAISLYESKKNSQSPGMRLPTKTLRITNLFPNESVEFSFGDLPPAARQSLAACFKESNTSQ
jgi:hypothetical protein